MRGGAGGKRGARGRERRKKGERVGKLMICTTTEQGSRHAKDNKNQISYRWQSEDREKEEKARMKLGTGPELDIPG